jgi:hypothetical protein
MRSNFGNLKSPDGSCLAFAPDPNGNKSFFGLLGSYDDYDITYGNRLSLEVCTNDNSQQWKMNDGFNVSGTTYPNQIVSKVNFGAGDYCIALPTGSTKHNNANDLKSHVELVPCTGSRYPYFATDATSRTWTANYVDPSDPTKFTLSFSGSTTPSCLNTGGFGTMTNLTACPDTDKTIRPSLVSWTFEQNTD